MTNINPIRFGITGSQFFKKEAKEDLENNVEKANVQPEVQVASKEVLGFMAAQNSDLVPAKATRTVDVAKYVTPEQAARIENFMKGFEADFDNVSAAAVNEFPDLSEAAAGNLALAYINASY